MQAFIEELKNWLLHLDWQHCMQPCTNYTQWHPKYKHFSGVGVFGSQMTRSQQTYKQPDCMLNTHV